MNQNTFLDYLTKTQSSILIMLFTLFSVLILSIIFFPENDYIQQPLTIVAGWLGVIIGFFFNQEVSASLRKQIKNNENIRLGEIEEEEDKIRDLNMNIDETVNNYEETITKLKEYIEEISKKKQR
jgi:hypothetical protein